MSSFVKQNSAILIKSLRQRMIKRKLFDSTLRFSDLYCVLKRFVKVDLDEYVSWLDADGVRQVVEGVMVNVQREMGKQKLLNQVWMKVFVVHCVFRLIIKNNHQIGSTLFPHLISLLGKYHNQLRQNHQTITPQLRPTSLISRGLSKIKRSISSNSIKQLFWSKLKNQKPKLQNLSNINTDWQNKKVEFTLIKEIKNQSLKMNVNCNRVNNFLSFDKKLCEQKNMKSNQQHNDIDKSLEQILHQYIKYLSKLLADWPSLNPFLSSYIIRSQFFPSTHTNNTQEHQPQITTQIFWKILNYFHTLSRVCKGFQKLSYLIQEYQIYIYGTINFIAEDLHLLYNPLVDFIMGSMKSIKWQEIIRIIGSAKEKRSLQKLTNNKQPQIARKLPPFVSQNILELKTMVEQLGNANEVILYIYNGYHHSKNLFNNRRPKSFISLNDKRFDVLFQLSRRIQEKGRRNIMAFDNKKEGSFYSLLGNNKMTMEFDNKSIQKKNLNPEQSKTNPIQQQITNQEALHFLKQQLKQTFITKSQNNKSNNMAAVKYKAHKLKEMMRSDLNKVASLTEKITPTEEETAIDTGGKV